MSDRKITFVVLFLLGCILGVVSYVVHFGYSRILILSAVLSVLVLFVLFVETRGGFDLFSPMFWVGPLFVILYAIPATERAVKGDFSFTGRYLSNSPPEVVIQKALLIAILGFVFLAAGYYAPVGKRLEDKVPQFSEGWSSERTWILITVLVVLGIGGYAGLLNELGTHPRSQLTSNKLAFIGVNLLLTSSILVMADLFINGFEYYNLKFIFKNIKKAAFGATLVLINVRLLWTLGGRTRAFISFIIALFLFHYLVNSFTLKEYVGVIFATKFVPGWMASIVAAIITLDIPDLYYHVKNIYLLTSSPTRPFNNYILLLAGMPEHLNFQYGRTFASAPFDLLPGQPFPETATVYNSVFAPWAVGKFGYPITMVGELYMNFWIPGIVAGMFLLGVLIRAFYEWSIVSARSTYASTVLFASLTNAYLIGGNFSNSAPQLGLKVVPLVACLYLITK